jgi:hypothetical protein
MKTTKLKKGWLKLKKDNKNLHETVANKNRTALLVVDRKKIRDHEIWLNHRIVELINNEIDTIIIDVKERKW